MALELRDTSFFGHALPEPFVKFQLEPFLQRRGLLPKATDSEGKSMEDQWDRCRAKIRLLGEQGGALRVAHHVLDPLVACLGYSKLELEEAVATREGSEDGGWLFTASSSVETRLRAWTVSVGTDLDAPDRRGRAYRFSPSRIAQRVLLVKGERAGLLTDGEELRLLLCDPARPDSHVAIRLDRSGGWRGARRPPDSFRLLIALASPAGIAALSEVVDEARLSQATVTKKLRGQARRAIESFIQEVLDQDANASARARWTDVDAVDAAARALWRESLIVVYRLLFIFKLESSADPARAFSFAATSPWRNTYSPNIALGRLVRTVLEGGADTGSMLEGGLRTVFRIFSEGLSGSEIRVSPLGGTLFGKEAIPLLDGLRWGERAVAKLLFHLLWTPGEGNSEPARVHYGALDVEDLGRVYEALLELEPGIAREPMCRLRRAKLEVVVPAAQGEPYRAREAEPSGPANEAADETEADAEDEADAEEATEEAAQETARPRRGAKTRVDWVEEVPAGRFFLRVGLGRKSSGSYYTPHAFVRFLVQETLRPQIEERSPRDDPRPTEILKLKVLDPAMGSGHFLVEACRYLADALYEACRLCDEKALEAEAKAEKAQSDKGKAGQEREQSLARARELRKRIEDLPDPQNELVAFLPSRVLEGTESGLSQKKAEALCRRLVAVHCLYGVDKNELAVALAKVSLWLESYAEGLPLTFLDHRLICGDSLTGPFFEHLLTFPKSGDRVEGIYLQGLTGRIKAALTGALAHVRGLEASIGKDMADLEGKRIAKARLDEALAPLKTLAAAWSGGVMLGEETNDLDYEALLRAVAEGGDARKIVEERPALARMIDLGAAGVPYDLEFPEVFHPDGAATRVGGFDAVLGNPPWDAIRRADDQFFGSFDLRAFAGATKREKRAVQEGLLSRSDVAASYEAYVEGFQQQDRIAKGLFTVHVARVQGNLAGRGTYNAFMLFCERIAESLRQLGFLGLVLPSAFHANEGATGVRRLYLERMGLCCCYSFENRNKLFEIDSRFKFAVVVARCDPVGTTEFACAFYLHDLEWLFEKRKPMRYSLDFVRRTGGEYLSLLELRSARDASVAQSCFTNSQPFAEILVKERMKLSQEVNMTYDSDRFTPVDDILPGGEDPRDPAVARRLMEKGYLVLHEGKTFHQYDDHWGDRPRYLVHLDQLADKPGWKNAARFYRLAFRDIARSTDERTGIFLLVPPSFLFGHTAVCERELGKHPAHSALSLGAVANSFVFDWWIRQKSAAHVSIFILNACPVPALPSVALGFLAHAALRLTCNHEGYSSLWTEQLGDAWREPKPRHTWPVLEDDDTRWAVRAAIDAVVAAAYGLDRSQYEHVLESFSHRSYPKAPALCLAAFDELQALGLEAFTKKHDPYWDIPLSDSLPKPVIDLPATGGEVVGPKTANTKNTQLDIFGTDMTRQVGQPSIELPSRKPTMKRRRSPT